MGKEFDASEVERSIVEYMDCTGWISNRPNPKQAEQAIRALNFMMSSRPR